MFKDRGLPVIDLDSSVRKNEANLLMRKVVLYFDSLSYDILDEKDCKEQVEEYINQTGSLITDSALVKKLVTEAYVQWWSEKQRKKEKKSKGAGKIRGLINKLTSLSLRGEKTNDFINIPNINEDDWRLSNQRYFSEPYFKGRKREALVLNDILHSDNTFINLILTDETGQSDRANQILYQLDRQGYKVDVDFYKNVILSMKRRLTDWE